MHRRNPSSRRRRCSFRSACSAMPRAASSLSVSRDRKAARRSAHHVGTARTAPEKPAPAARDFQDELRRAMRSSENKVISSFLGPGIVTSRVGVGPSFPGAVRSPRDRSTLARGHARGHEQRARREHAIRAAPMDDRLVDRRTPVRESDRWSGRHASRHGAVLSRDRLRTRADAGRFARRSEHGLDREQRGDRARRRGCRFARALTCTAFATACARARGAAAGLSTAG